MASAALAQRSCRSRGRRQISAQRPQQLSLALALTLSALRFSVVAAIPNNLRDLPPFLWETEMQRQAIKNRIVFTKPVLDLTPENFERETYNSTEPMVLGFFAKGCRYCKRTLPGFEGLAKLSKGSLRFGAVDNKAYPQLGNPLGVRHIPVFFYMEPGMPWQKYFGPRTNDDVQVWIGFHGGVDVSHLPLWKQLPLTAFHFAISSLVAAFEFLEIQPTDHGPGQLGDYTGPLPDGGNLGFAGVLIGIAVVYLGTGFGILMMVVLGCRCCSPFVKAVDPADMGSDDESDEDSESFLNRLKRKTVRRVIPQKKKEQ